MFDILRCVKIQQYLYKLFYFTYRLNLDEVSGRMCKCMRVPNEFKTVKSLPSRIERCNSSQIPIL